MTDEKSDFTWNKNHLYREESITDLKTGSIRVLIPVKPDGSVDESRDQLFIGHAQLRSPEGMVPLQAELQASHIEEAMEKYPEAMTQALQKLIDAAQKRRAGDEARKREASPIIMPEK